MPRISCLCVTERRLPYLRRAFRCFRKQTHRERELIVVYREDDMETAAFVQSHAKTDRSVIAVSAPASREFTLGHLRNLGVARASGDYVAVWDDDDWHAPHRLSEQLLALRSANLPASALGRIAIYDDLTQVAYHSRWRAWEGTLLCSVEQLGCSPYAHRDRREDTPVLRALELGRSVVLLDRPDLYVYVFHASNTSPEAHKRSLICEDLRMEPHWSAQLAHHLAL